MWLWISIGVVAFTFSLFVVWLHYDRLGEEGRQSITNAILDRHRELAGEGDECPWSVRLTSADKRSAMQQARVELGLERDRRFDPPTTAEIETTEWVEITHPTSLGNVGRVTREAYELVWKAKGWIIVPEGHYLKIREVLIPRAKEYREGDQPEAAEVRRFRGMPG